MMTPNETLYYNIKGLSFEDWKAKVDGYIADRIGLTSDDLPDQSYYEWFESGIHPKHAANRAIKLSLD